MDVLFVVLVPGNVQLDGALVPRPRRCSDMRLRRGTPNGPGLRRVTRGRTLRRAAEADSNERRQSAVEHAVIGSPRHTN
ncbi:hypothetical protein [Nocardia brasiliensis]|uniref:hypothetical protein n=1 Tax=Nocardia brasiliensis TaxID=37326 RepID=UPI00142E6E65|nr:hypothetical protein [Nocardia brasiliensis]